MPHTPVVFQMQAAGRPHHWDGDCCLEELVAPAQDLWTACLWCQSAVVFQVVSFLYAYLVVA